MKLSTIKVAAEILAGVKLNRISDKKVKATLVNDYLHLRAFAKKAEEDNNELVRKFQSDWADELAAVNALRSAGKPVVGHDAYLEAEKDANEAISAIYSAEVDATPKAVKMDDFMASCGGEELTLEQIALLQEGGIIEA